MLANPAITQDEASNVEKGIQELVKEVKGSVISFERWGKFRLAYPVKKNDYGIYFLTRFEVPTAQTVLETIKTAFAVKYNEIVMRHVVVRLDEKQSLEYKRPQSVEDAPVARDVDSFLRENNMEGLRGSAARDNDKRSDALGNDLDESFNDEELN
jgi:small subunit ribosomal protein S6